MKLCRPTLFELPIPFDQSNKVHLLEPRGLGEEAVRQAGEPVVAQADLLQVGQGVKDARRQGCEPVSLYIQSFQLTLIPK